MLVNTLTERAWPMTRLVDMFMPKRRLACGVDMASGVLAYFLWQKHFLQRILFDGFPSFSSLCSCIY